MAVLPHVHTSPLTATYRGVRNLRSLPCPHFSCRYNCVNQLARDSPPGVSHDFSPYCRLTPARKPSKGHRAMKTRSTTILTVRHQGVVAMGGDGQVTVNNTIMKADVNKIRRLMDGRVMTGFAGATADAFALLERFEAKLKDYPSNVPRAATELAKEWRTDRVLRRLEAMMAVVDSRHTLLVTGNGDVVQRTDGVLGIGSGGNFAVAAARALMAHSSLSAVEIVRTALTIASGIDVYTNSNIVVEEMECEE
jgi:ATP-dependent HslUV protease, peptidase subunit HslV